MAIDGDILEFEAVFPFQQTLELPPEICRSGPPISFPRGRPCGRSAQRRGRGEQL